MDCDFWQSECPDTPNAPTMSPDAGGGCCCAAPASMMSSDAVSLTCRSAAGCPRVDEHEDAGPSEGPHAAQQSARPKSKYTLAGFVGFLCG